LCPFLLLSGALQRAKGYIMTTNANPLGRPLSPSIKRDYLLAVPITHTHREALQREAEDAGYRSLAAYIRERKLAEPPATRSA
jgi:hypothetical protein